MAGEARLAPTAGLMWGRMAYARGTPPSPPAGENSPHLFIWIVIARSGATRQSRRLYCMMLWRQYEILRSPGSLRMTRHLAPRQETFLLHLWHELPLGTSPTG